MSNVDVHALLNDVNLIGISTIALSARRADGVVDQAGESSVDPQYTLHTGWRDDERGFRIVLQTEIDAAVGAIRCDVQAEYELQDLEMSLVSAGTMQEFVNNVAVMAVLPFVRQGIADITLRVFESPLLMPIMQRGQITFGVQDQASGALED